MGCRPVAVVITQQQTQSGKPVNAVWEIITVNCANDTRQMHTHCEYNTVYL